MKVKKNDIEQALSKLKSSTSTLQTSLPQSIQGNNVLDLVTELNNLNRAIEEMAQSYKQLLIQNEEATRQSVQFIVDTDKKLSIYAK